MNKLDPVWKHMDNPVRWKLIIFDAVIKSKLMYGLESAQINEAQKKKLDVFQLKGLRKILDYKTTFIDISNTNEFIYKTSIEEINRPTTPNSLDTHMSCKSKVT